MKIYEKPLVLETQLLSIEAQQSTGLPPEPPPPGEGCC